MRLSDVRMSDDFDFVRLIEPSFFVPERMPMPMPEPDETETEEVE